MGIRPLHRGFESVNELYGQLALELMLDGEDVTLINAEKNEVVTRELLKYDFIFQPFYDNVVTLPARKLNKDLMLAEFLWYMTANRNVDVIAKYLPNWKKFANDGIVNSNYGLYWKNSWQYIVSELTADIRSRRAVISVYDSMNSANFGKDTPCTVDLQFMIRKDHTQTDDYLHMYVTMRSNDIIYGLSIDQFCNSMVHQLLYNELKQTYPDLKLGNYYHTSRSMHCYYYSCDAKKLQALYKEAVEQNIESDKFYLPENVTMANFWQTAESLFNAEMWQHFKDNVVWA